MDNNGNNNQYSQNGQTNAQPPLNQGQAYGVYYTVGGNGQTYSYSSYPEQQRPAENNAKQKKKGIRTFAAVLAIILAFTILFSAVCIGTSYVISAFSRTNEHAENTPEVQQPKNGTVKVSDGEALVTETVPAGDVMILENAVAAVRNSVVEITTETVVYSSFFSQQIASGAGSGVIISDTGYIITNNHVIEEANKISVRLVDGKRFEATLVGTDEENDIAVLSIEPGTEKLTPAVIGDSDKVALAQSIFVIGNPLGQLGGSVSSGIISCTEREIAVENSTTMTLMQTDAAVNPGNSGGGLFNLRGELIGIVNAKSSGSSIEGLGFAIPINTAWNVASELINYGYVRGRASLGINVLEVDSMYARYYFGTNKAGVYIYKDDASIGVKKADRIVSINDTEIESYASISSFLKKATVGDTVTLTLVRDGKTVTVKVVLKEKVPESQNTESKQ